MASPVVVGLAEPSPDADQIAELTRILEEAGESVGNGNAARPPRPAAPLRRRPPAKGWRQRVGLTKWLFDGDKGF